MIDLAFMVSATDIPDWGFAEVLKEPFIYPLDESERKKLWDQSPMSKISNIEAPVLLMIGAKDRRVSMANVIPFYNYMKTKEKRLKCYISLIIIIH